MTPRGPSRPQLAVLLTSYGETSHGVCICTKLLEGLEFDDGVRAPRCDVVAIHLMEVADDDVGVATAQRHGVPLYHSVAAALCRGGDDLAVDGVVVVGEHGSWPRNDKGQKLYPRRELFDQVVGVFRQAGRVVPVFMDKHLSWNRAWALAMWSDVQRLGIPFMAGSSLPYADFAPPLPAEPPAHRLVAAGYGGVEDYGFHALETAQFIAERRAGGEAGVRAVRCLAGAAAQASIDSGWPGDLVEAVTRAGWELDRLPAPDDVVAFELDHLDGFRTLVLLAGGYAVERSFGVGYETGDGVFAAAYHLDPLPRVKHFSTMVAAMEDMFLTRRPPCPPERTVLTTVVLSALLDSLAADGATIELLDSPSYRPNAEL